MQILNYKLKNPNFDFQETGIFEGYASVFGKLDYHNEIVSSGAFTKSLKKWEVIGERPKMLWQHDQKSPIGVWEEIKEDDYGLFVRGRLLLEIQKGMDAYKLLKSGIIDGLSIGFQTKNSHKENNVKIIEEVDLFEISLVTFMANPFARITSTKNWTETYEQTIKLKERILKLKYAMDKLDEENLLFY